MSSKILMNGIDVAGMVRAGSLAALPGIRHGFFTRTGGVSQGIYASLNGGLGSHDAAAQVAENRARMAAALAVRPERLITAYQTHSVDVVTADAPWSPDTRPRADAIVTRARGLAIAVTTADCGPVLFADAQAGVIGAAHAGWRGAFDGVLEATIAALECCGADRSRVVVALGPMIRQPNYEVGPEFVARFTAADTANERFFKPSARAGHGLFDLAGYIAARLRASGIDHIEDTGRCTYGEPGEFFSYRGSTHRGEPDYGRHVNGIALAEDS
jgi:YfiH family protein